MGISNLIEYKILSYILPYTINNRLKLILIYS